LQKTRKERGAAGCQSNRLHLGTQLPFRACVGDPESVTLGIALGVAARHSHHHCQIASMIEGFFIQSRLKTLLHAGWRWRACGFRQSAHCGIGVFDFRVVDCATLLQVAFGS